LFRKELISKLITTGHLNVLERKELENLSVSFEEILMCIKNILEEHKFFPVDARPWEPGLSVWENSLIEKLNFGKYRLHLQRSYPLNPYQLAEIKHDDYNDLNSVLQEFVRIYWGKDIDGIPIN
jgi:hypothetical protein